MKARLKISLASLCILGSTACVTGSTQTLPPSKPKEKLIEKEGQKVEPSQAAVPPASTSTDLAGLSQRVNKIQQ